jgi:hypothetical protein
MNSNRVSRPRTARLALAAGLAALAALPLAAHAQMAHMAPGLWEQTMSMKSSNPEMEARMAESQQRMASLPPEQRAMIEAQMKAHGVQMSGGPGGPGGTTIRICVSKEMSEREPTPPKESRCEHQQMERTGSTVKYKFSCAGRDGQPPTTGEGTFTMTGPNSYSGTSTMNTMVQGKPTQMSSTMTGKWLGSDCGDIKPMQVPKGH